MNFYALRRLRDLAFTVMSTYMTCFKGEGIARP